MRKFLTLLGLTCLIVVLLGSIVSAELIEVAPEGRYFQRGDEAFLVIGPNDAITWPGLSPLLGGGSYSAVDNYVAKMADKGINTLRVMLEYAQVPHGLIENPLGHYREDVVNFWDEFFEILERHNMYVIITPWDPFWMQPNWSSNPYNVENGGMLRSMNGFLTNPEAIEAQKARFEFMIERWGDSQQILAWELMNEIELWWGASPGEIYDWIDMMADFVREKQLEYHGFTQLITVSSAAATPSGRLADVIYNHPKLDFANTHLYTGSGMNAPTNTTDVAEEVALAVNYALFMLNDNRPYTDTESGPIEQWIGSARFDAEFLHNVSWSHLASGGAGTGMRWPYRTPHILTDEMMNVLGRIAQFTNEFDFTGFAPNNISVDLIAPLDHQVYGIGDDTRMLVWMLRDDRAQGEAAPATLTLDYIVPGTYQVSLWDPWEAQWITQSTMSFNETKGELEIPAFEKDITIVLELLD